MKKNRKVAERNKAETIGIDLGDRMSRYFILNDESLAVEEGSFRNHADFIARHFGGRARARVAMDKQSAWIAREFAKLGHEVIVADARELKWITLADDKNDRNDARKLARADRNLLQPVEHRTAEQQAELAVIRARDALVRSRTLLVNTARSLAKGFGLRLPASITHTFGGAGAGWSGRALAPGNEAFAGADRRLGREDRRLRSTGPRTGGAASGDRAVGGGARRGDADRGDVRVDAGPQVKIRAQPRRGPFPRPACAATAIGRARSATGDQQAATSICAYCWCSARITSSGIGERIRRSGSGACRKATAARAGNARWWPWRGSWASCSIGCG